MKNPKNLKRLEQAGAHLKSAGLMFIWLGGLGVLLSVIGLFMTAKYGLSAALAPFLSLILSGVIILTGNYISNSGKFLSEIDKED